MKKSWSILVIARKVYENVFTDLDVWRDRVRRLTTDPLVMCSSPATDILVYVMHCWLISLNKLNLIT